MIKKITFVILIVLTVSCGTNKSIIQTVKTDRVKANNTTSRVVHKAIVKRTPEKPSETVAVKSSVSATEVLEATTRVKVTAEIVLAYIDQFKEISKSNMAQFGIPSSIILAQGILESGAGTGSLSTKANNHFGIKCHKDWTGSSVKHDDDSAQECFRKYDQANESYKDHALFLMNRPWYSGLFKLDKADYQGWAKGLKSAGYATDPKYPEKLIGIIERYQLNQYDAEVLGKNYVASVRNDISLIKADPNAYKVSQGDTLYSISKKFNLTVDELKRKNNMSDNAISIGQHLKVN